MTFGPGNGNTIAQDAATYQLLINNNKVEEAIPVLGMTIDRTFNKIATARLVIKDGKIGDGENRRTDFPIQNKDLFVPGNKIEIKIGHRGENGYLAFTGIITGIKIRVRKTSSKLIVDCRSSCYRMTLQPKNRYFTEDENNTDSDIITTLLQDYNIANEMQETTFSHPELVQYEASDWHFLLSRAEENGLFVIIDESDKVFVSKPDFTKPPVAMAEYGRNVYELDAEIDARLQFDGSKVQSWDFNEQHIIDQEGIPLNNQEVGDMSAEVLAEKNKGGTKVIRNGGFKLDGELQAKADAILMRDRLAKVRGRVRMKSTQKIVPGDLIDLRSLGNRFDGIALVSGVRYELSSESWMLDIQFGFSNEWKIEQLAKNDTGGLSKFVPGISGLHIGLVTQIHDDPEESNRIQVRLPLIDKNGDGVWARIAALDAGQGRGSFFMPEVDDEVIVGFIDNDPKEAVVLGMLHSSVKSAPFEATEENTQKGFFSREGIKILFDEEKKSVLIETPEDNKIIINDEGNINIRANSEVIINEGSEGAARKNDEVEITIPSGTFITTVSGGSGAAAVGTPNLSDLKFQGKIISSSNTVKIGD